MATLKPAIKSGLMNNPTVVEKKPRLSESEAKALIERMRAYDSEMVTGIFENLEAPGQGMRFSIHLYPGDDFDVYELFDGERYRIPRGVARHLNQGCAYKTYATLNAMSGAVNGAAVEGAAPVRDGRYSGGSMHSMIPTAKKYRVSFKSLEFSDDTLDLFQSSMALPNVDHILPKVI
jgi:hypothetical protein